MDREIHPRLVARQNAESGARYLDYSQALLGRQRMSNLYIHIGTHKTGTTTIQKTLYKNQTLLKAHGIEYPDYTLIGKKSHYAHFGIANALAGLHDKLSKSDAQNFFCAVRELAKSRIVFLSAESLYRHYNEAHIRKPASVEDYWERRHYFINELFNLTGPAQIVLVLRSQADLAQSLYQERIKVTRYTGTFKRFLGESWHYFDYLKQYEMWAGVYGRHIHVIPFAKISGPSIAKKLLNTLALAPGRLRPSERANESLRPEWVKVKRILNGSSFSREQLDAFVKVMLRNSSQLHASPKHYFDNYEHARDFQGKFVEANNALSHLAGDDLAHTLNTLAAKPQDAFGDDIQMDEVLAALNVTMSELLRIQ